MKGRDWSDRIPAEMDYFGVLLIHKKGKTKTKEKVKKNVKKVFGKKTQTFTFDNVLVNTRVDCLFCAHK